MRVWLCTNQRKSDAKKPRACFRLSRTRAKDSRMKKLLLVQGIFHKTKAVKLTGFNLLFFFREWLERNQD